MKKQGMFVQIAAIKFSGAPKGAISAKFHLISIRNDFKINNKSIAIFGEFRFFGPVS
jgi:hypothetical protein